MVKAQTVGYNDWLRVSIKKVAVVHFFLLAGYALQIIVMDAWHIIVPDVVLLRWIAVCVATVGVAICWYLAHNLNNSTATLKRILFGLVTTGIAFAAFNVYIQRGMAARAVILFVIPIIVSAVLLNRAAIFATAVFSAAAYIIATVSYFVLNFNEGYKTELYAEVGFYCFLFFMLAALLSTIVRFGGSTNDA